MCRFFYYSYVKNRLMFFRNAIVEPFTIQHQVAFLLLKPSPPVEPGVFLAKA